MAISIKGKPNGHSEVPNSQVLATAQQFHSAFLLLENGSRSSRVVLPAFHCAAISLELYLKSLSAYEVAIPISEQSSVSFVRAKHPKKSHVLADLFDLAPEDIRASINDAMRTSSLLSQHSSFRHALVAHESLFLASRYAYEPESTLSGARFDVLTELLAALKTGIERVAPRWVRSASPIP
jgi:hypothetical protein